MDRKIQEFYKLKIFPVDPVVFTEILLATEKTLHAWR
jgi:hypothetical protein